MKLVETAWSPPRLARPDRENDHRLQTEQEFRTNPPNRPDRRLRRELRSGRENISGNPRDPRRLQAGLGGRSRFAINDGCRLRSREGVVNGLSRLRVAEPGLGQLCGASTTHGCVLSISEFFRSLCASDPFPACVRHFGWRATVRGKCHFPPSNRLITFMHGIQ